MHHFITEWLIRKAKKTPYFHLEGYMNRWWLVPIRATKGSYSSQGCGPVKFYKRPIAWILQKFNISVKIHEILRSDDDRAFHDHPWPYITVILKGGYWEHKPSFNSSGVYLGTIAEWYGPGSVIFRKANSWHRLELLERTTYRKYRDAFGWKRWETEEVAPVIATTLFITGRYKQKWGFLPNPKYKIPYDEYLKEEL